MNSGSKTILVVDDSKEIRELVATTLENEESIVLIAEDAIEALQMSRKHKPHLIIMDVGMPGKINGIEATRQIKADHQTKDCVVIMLSGDRDKTNIRRALDAGAYDYLTKPFSPLELIEKVETILEGSCQ
ncbi:MAG: response regulator [Chitinivibrionales bacterium]